MKFQPDTTSGVNLITRRDSDRLWVGSTPYAHSVLVPWVGDVLPWHAAAMRELSAAHFQRILALRPKLVIFGSGALLRFPPPEMLRALIDQGIGVETMDTAAACRTYNVLVSEHRSAVAALLVESAP